MCRCRRTTEQVVTWRRTHKINSRETETIRLKRKQKYRYEEEEERRQWERDTAFSLRGWKTKKTKVREIQNKQIVSRRQDNVNVFYEEKTVLQTVQSVFMFYFIIFYTFLCLKSHKWKALIKLKGRHTAVITCETWIIHHHKHHHELFIALVKQASL